MRSTFTRKLLLWHTEINARLMPWKGETDPYKIWLSEVILQQTRVEQGLKYYSSFVETFPSVHDLARASEKEVFKLWEGLGYYSRCKNLLSTAKFISDELRGIFPQSYEAIRSLKGIGPYTAAAISSFAFNLPHAAVDGNVIRVISRYFGISTPVNNEGRKMYNLLAETLLDKKRPGIFNQAIMDFGAVICKPKQPLCHLCIQKSDCQAYKHKWTDRLPFKEKAAAKKIRWFIYYIIEYDNFLYIRKRKKKDIWENLYEFVLYEQEGVTALNDNKFLRSHLKTITEGAELEIFKISGVYRQHLTHQTIMGQFVTVKVFTPPLSLKGYSCVPAQDLPTYPFPKLISNYLFKKEII